MLLVAKGNCPRCGKSYSDFGTLTDQEITFSCESCGTRYELCPDCQRQVPKICIKCGGRLLDPWEYMKVKFGTDVIF